MSASVRAASSGNPGAASSDLALLRAAPARPGTAPSPTTARGKSEPDPGHGPSAGTAGEAQSGLHAPQAAPAKTTDSAARTATTQTSRSAFGATLAASMSASTSSKPGATPARGAKAKATDAKSLLAQATAGLVLAAPVPAAALVPAGTAAGAATAAPSAATAAPSAATAAPSDSAAPESALSGGARASPVSAATDEPAAEPAAASASAADTATRAADALVLNLAQLPGSKPVAPLTPGNRPAVNDEIDGPVSESPSASASAPTAPTALTAAAAAPITAPHAPFTQLLTSGHGEGSSQGDAQGGSPSPDGTLGALSGAGGGMQPAAAATLPAASPVSVPVHSEVGSGGWAQELGVRLNWMAQQGISSASLKLTPEQLGPVEVRISVHQNTASVWFGAAQADTRSALEQALPKLREMFSSQGLNLAHTGVSDQSARSAPREPQTTGARAPAALRELNTTPVTSRTPLHPGLIDTYA